MPPRPSLTDSPGLSSTVARVSAAHCGGLCRARPIREPRWVGCCGGRDAKVLGSEVRKGVFPRTLRVADSAR